MANRVLLRNAKIFTGDARHPWAHSLAIIDGRVAGLDADADAWAGVSGLVVEDLAGAPVIPGLTDAHVHLMWYALSLRELPLRDVSREALLEMVAARAATTPPGTWIRGRGWDQTLWPDRRFPTAADLDPVAPHHPVALTAKNAHALVANTAAMQAAHVTATAPDPPFGKLGRNDDGAPDGMFFEHAIRLIQQAIPAPSLAEVVDALDEAQGRLLAAGLTCVHDVDGNPAFAAFQELRRQDRLRLRVVKYIRREALEGALATGLRSGFGDDCLRFGGLKLFADGALGARTGAMVEPYLGEPDNVGLLTLDPADLLEVARQAAAGGIALAIHAIGDRANRVVLDVLEAVKLLEPALRHRVEHVQHILPEDQPRLGRLGLIASMQPIHATHDMDMVERYLGARAGYAYPWRSIAASGAVLAFGSDMPIEVFDPFLGLYAATTRRREDGSPGSEGWFPEQRLTLPEALRAYTWGAAYAAGQESRLGLLLPGYLADLVVLSRDIFSAPPEALLETPVQRVMVGGTWQFSGE
ncbi:MAG: amidohydrolase [Anaerolineae bacterium]|nr:amidohydrolase [Anaerolineae bacterium]